MSSIKSSTIEDIEKALPAMTQQDVVALRAQLAYVDAKATARLNELRDGKPHKCE